eukprot:TRINITY_DN14256_c0_g1_i7.p2 TRINITY_DN14256_c0_g1~~TRINITY_DN14256_c0_g1_i7.p2  ORF type:complete len:136 (+),score=14.95 TRINITY_DN14256_c0_g1_i7:174-581(+)
MRVHMNLLIIKVQSVVAERQQKVITSTNQTVDILDIFSDKIESTNLRTRNSEMLKQNRKKGKCKHDSQSQHQAAQEEGVDQNGSQHGQRGREEPRRLCTNQSHLGAKGYQASGRSPDRQAERGASGLHPKQRPCR